MATRTILFLSNRTQVVRLPKAVAFDDSVRDVAILRDGPRRIVVPVDATWDDFFEATGVDLCERTQPAAQVRDSFSCCANRLDTNNAAYAASQ